MRLLRIQLVVCYKRPQRDSPGACQDSGRTAKGLKSSTCWAQTSWNMRCFVLTEIACIIRELHQEPREPAWWSIPPRQSGSFQLAFSWICRRVHASKQAFVAGHLWWRKSCMRSLSQKNQSAMNRKESFIIVPYLSLIAQTDFVDRVTDCIGLPNIFSAQAGTDKWTSSKLQSSLSLSVWWCVSCEEIQRLAHVGGKKCLVQFLWNSTFSSFFQSIIKWVCWDVLASSLSTAYLSWCLSWIFRRKALNRERSLRESALPQLVVRQFHHTVLACFGQDLEPNEHPKINKKACCHRWNHQIVYILYTHWFLSIHYMILYFLLSMHKPLFY